MSQVLRKGKWIEERLIGSGGFGTVSLWKNEETGQKIALKRCRLQNEMTAKHKQRWQLEVQIMQRLDHENVIAAHVVPAVLDVNPPELPLLAMEYCSGGDLRRLLSMPQNCCGLSEYTVRCLVGDMAAAVEYLHSKRIIHRDLKPENIVLKTVDERTVYKVIDLGYAKELDQGSVCTSFVGTLQYLAPELYTSKKYTCTVDYWSFGNVVFECIAGYRPFLPKSPPIKWHSEVCKKSPDDICVRLEGNEEVKFYKNIPSPTRLSRSVKTYLEEWLRYMLRWDPKARGGGIWKENRPTCFYMLDTILAMKIIYLLDVANNKLLTYPIIDDHTMMNVHQRIEEETKIPIEEQDIILATGMSPEKDKSASQCWMEPSQEEQDCLVYMFRKGGEDYSTENRNKKLPPTVQDIVREPSTVIPYAEQKRAWAEATYFCEEIQEEFKRLMLSQRAAMLSLIRKDTTFMKVKTKMTMESITLKSKIDYFLESLNHDLKFYQEQANSGGISSEKMSAEWLKMAQEVEGLKELKQQSNEIGNQSDVIQTKFVELQKSPFARSKLDDTLKDLAKQAKHVYQEFRQVTKDSKNAMRDQKSMVTVVVKCVMWRDKKVPDLYAHLGKLGKCKADVERLLPLVQVCLTKILDAGEKLLAFQKQRQAGIWKLVEWALKQDKSERPPGQTDDMMDASGYCRNEAQPTPVPGGSMLTSMMSTSSVESLQVMEDSRVTTKMFEEAMNNLMLDQDEFTSMLSVSQTSAKS